jgi:hypothetical protein
MMNVSLNSMKQKAAVWLRQGISPRRLALTLALGFAIGCLPVVGVTTAVCLVLAMALRLNLPAIQAANWAAMPFQVVLLVPFVRLGGWLFTSGQRPALNAGALMHLSPLHMVSMLGGMAGHALGAWLLLAVPAVALITLTLTPVLRRVPAVAAAGD